MAPARSVEMGAMKLNRNYAGPADMPATIPLFPLEGALLLPRRPIQLTVFEPRYLAMLDDALSGDRLVGVIQPTSGTTPPFPHRGSIRSAAPVASSSTPRSATAGASSR